jgi:dihydroxy-acid dehydratase
MQEQKVELNTYSSRITQPKSQAASQAMLLATGLSNADLDKPQIGIASCWYEGNPCNMHLDDLGIEVKKGVVGSGLIGMRFDTIGVSDGISMGTDGMSYSLQSRDLIADSIETVMSAQWYDGLVALPGCDKNMPGVVMAMGRLNRPSIMVYGGTIRAGCGSVGGVETKLDVVSAFQSYGQFLAGTITEEERQTIVDCSIPGAGACGGTDSPPHCDPCSVRERDGRDDGTRRLHECCAAHHRDGSSVRARAHHRRLAGDQRTNPVAG